MSNKLCIKFIRFCFLADSACEAFYVHGISNNEGNIRLSAGYNKRLFKTSSRLNSDARYGVFFLDLNGVFNATLIVFYSKVNV